MQAVSNNANGSEGAHSEMRITFRFERRLLVNYCILVFVMMIFGAYVGAMAMFVFVHVPFHFSLSFFMATAFFAIPGSYFGGEIGALGSRVILDEQGIERRWFGRSKRVAWNDVAFFKMPWPMGFIPVHLFGHDGKRLLILPGNVDGAAIARLLLARGIPQKRRRH